MHDSTYDYMKPTEAQMEQMEKLRAAARTYGQILEAELPDGPDKTYVIRRHRETAMWVMVCVTRQPDGTPRP